MSEFQDKILESVGHGAYELSLMLSGIKSIHDATAKHPDKFIRWDGAKAVNSSLEVAAALAVHLCNKAGEKEESEKL